MSRSHRPSNLPNFKGGPPALKVPPIKGSLLDIMVDGQEYQSIIAAKPISFNLDAEMKRAISDIQAIRKRPIICYIANLLNPAIEGKASISIDNSDDMPFAEILRVIPPEEKAVDIIIVTPGGFAETVDYMVKKLRERFEHIAFILPYMAMSAGTIMCMSGDELIMSESAFIGPIDPQVRSKNGGIVPAQSVLTLIEDIKKRGELLLADKKKIPWTDIEIIRHLDPKEIGNAITASKLSTTLVTEYLRLYKFRDWDKHHDGREVTPEERDTRAKEIADLLCDNSVWLSHSSRISRDIAEDKLQLRIKHPEDIEGLDRAIRRFWALLSFTLENNTIAKIYAAGDYFLIRGIKLSPMKA